MSRRLNPGADRAEVNRATLKSLVKLESNKSCADCKRNKHPRWASWNLGIFVCIRCSGIHRGMGTHISRVKSVDLDSWTDEQLNSMLKWGNARANKYWEAKLAPGHVPSEAKIENFIRTKYDSKRWVMDGGIPDPSTLTEDGDDDVPLNVVQEKAKIGRSESQRAGQPSGAIRPPPNVDLFGDDPAPVRPSTTEPSMSRQPPPKAAPAPPKASKPADSLLGLDFLGGSQSTPPARAASATPTSSGSTMPSRPDLKQSILSLYAAAPKPQPQPSHSHHPSGSFGGMQSPPMQSPQLSSFGGMNDAFSGLNFSSQPAQQPAQQPAPKPSPFDSLTSSFSQRSTPSQSTSTSAFGGGGSFFDPTPSKSPQPAPQSTQQRSMSSSGGFGDFFSSTPSPAATAPKPAASTSMGGDLFDFATPASQPPPPAAPKPTPSYNKASAFNLSQPAQSALPKPQVSAQSSSTFSNIGGMSNMDAWGSNDVWASNPSTAAAHAKPSPAPAASSDFGWGSSTTPAKSGPAEVTADEEFGGWSSAAPVTPAAGKGQGTGTGGFGGDDLFSNVWQ
ncbi:ArfGap-domain-containing protein [Aulographum hederae CBS 113979]|uniref:ArfGap-domain-containing protein n=1 Tax=Aulographum hederae CBS 113979 TaxID=1176131 RepID=A0A6G1GM92_9PEZI|nr:ArfGap-domain-containing protein [Aulographum hederae CBS 113979]